jgi:hypothetical protein
MNDHTLNRLLLRIYISSTDKFKDSLLYEHIVFMAKEYGLAGATALKGLLGYGASSIIHSYKFWEISEKVPVVIEILDVEDKVLGFYDTIKKDLEEMRYGCLVTTEKINILLYKSGNKSIKI